MLVFVALEVIEIRLYEVIVQINTFKVGDGLIFGYVLRRKESSSQILCMYKLSDENNLTLQK